MGKMVDPDKTPKLLYKQRVYNYCKVLFKCQTINVLLAELCFLANSQTQLSYLLSGDQWGRWQRTWHEGGFENMWVSEEYSDGEVLEIFCWWGGGSRF